MKNKNFTDRILTSGAIGFSVVAGGLNFAAI